MTFLLRPERGRLAGGVARGIAEQYQLHTGIVRAVLLCAILTAPITLLAYLFLWIAMPSEDSVLEHMQLAHQGDETSDVKRFDLMARTMLRRTGVTAPRRGIGAQFLAFSLLLIAFVLELPRLEGVNFYSEHPYVSSIYAIVARHASAALYLALAFAFFAMDRVISTPVVLRGESRSDLALDQGATKTFGGLASGFGRVLGIDPSWLRATFVLLNILTFGGAGVLYLAGVWLLKSKGKTFADDWNIASRQRKGSHLSSSIRITIGFLFLLLAIIRISTEYRIFFFNEPFFRGMVLVIVGAALAIRAFKIPDMEMMERLWLLIGAIVLLLGIFDLATAIFQVQPSFTERFEIAYLIGALAFAYYTLVASKGGEQDSGFIIAGVFLFFAALLQFNLAPARYLLALVQFYDFFFPVLFAGFGLWLVMERKA